MVFCTDLRDLELTIRCSLVASMEALTVEELWNKVNQIYDGPHNIQLELFGYKTFFELLKKTPSVVQVILKNTFMIFYTEQGSIK